MSSNKRGFMRTLLTSNGGCGCGKPKPSEVHQPTPKPKISIYQNTNPSTSSTTSGDRNDQLSAEDENFTSTTISEAETHHHKDHNNNNNNKGATKNVSALPKPSPKIVDTIAFEKESKDPYRDFRYSMLQMIFEKEIFSESGLQELLQCFLELNAPCHYQVIVQAFMEICEETFPKKFCGDGDGDGDGGGEPSCRN